MPLRYRPLGPAGSVVEILVGSWLLAGVLWTNETYGTTLVATVSALGAVILLVGIVGLVASARAWIRSGSTRT
jgi:hypothetical protein